MAAKPNEIAERLAEERAAQEQWRPRENREKTAGIFDQFIEREFRSADEQAARARERLRVTVDYAAESIPYYRDLLARLELTPNDFAEPEDLTQLPILGKATIAAEESRLRPEKLPKGETDGGWNTSSGTTGKPVTIYRTIRTRDLDLIFTQRQFRWYRFDPLGRMAAMRLADNLPPLPGGRPIRLGEAVESDDWPGVGQIFVTGPYFGFDLLNPAEDQIAWLQGVRPNYIHTGSSDFEHLALATQDGPKFEGLRGLRAMSEPMTPGMEARIADTLGAPVYMSYGLNEIGWVASRCAAGRYHVHAERFVVEIVGEDGKPCAPGEFGRLLVTDLANAAMPLLRYDSDDIARAVTGPCPCARTLPSFGPVTGRYSHMKGLPAGTMEIVTALREAMERLPADLSRPLREYQVRQTRGGDFELHVVLAGALSPGFHTYMDEAWGRALAAAGKTKGGGPTFALREVAEIPRTPSKKFMHFVSEIARPREDKDYAAAGGPADTGQ